MFMDSGVPTLMSKQSRSVPSEQLSGPEQKLLYENEHSRSGAGVTEKAVVNPSRSTTTAICSEHQELCPFGTFPFFILLLFSFYVNVSVV